jgi:glucosylceramidase
MTRNTAYYTVAHTARFGRPGSVRLATNISGFLTTVVFKAPTRQKILVVLNNGSTAQPFDMQHRSQVVTTTLAAGTYVW